MKELKPEILRSFRMEMIGTGCYDAMARRYEASRPELSKRFRAMADSERGHGALFQKCHAGLYGSKMSGESFWLFMGKLSALSQALLPLKMNLKILSGVEKLAVKQIEAALAAGGNSKFHDILKNILPDEKEHAALYNDWVSGKV
ncbi:MAG: hypothetical protein JXA07_01815 [Spirochaetes bacterium]|nr:hypothetical protein [Spirochaetota bacterium]